MAPEARVYQAIVHPAVTVILEEGPNNWSAYVPAIPGCIATGRDRQDVERQIGEALTFHLLGLHQDALREEAEASARSARA